MTETKQLPYLLKLLDDDSAQVQEAILKQLVAFGPHLKEEVLKFTEPFSERQKELLNKVVESYQRTHLREHWSNWYGFNSDFDKLEMSLSLLSDFLIGVRFKENLGDLLESLAQEFKMRYSAVDELRLAQFLFYDKGLQGAKFDYYNPLNSSLVYVIKERRGIPISLVLIYMLVGQRLGMDIRACNLPGHFMGRIKINNHWVLVDCFNKGQIIEEDIVASVIEQPIEVVKEALLTSTNALSIIKRFLLNLIRCFQLKEDSVNYQFIVDLLNELEKIEVEKENTVSQSPRFRIGETVYHKLYGYRGLIVDYDPECKASDNWYFGNKSQPLRSQNWYHVLVDNSDEVTYAAETNLCIDESKEKITHPLIKYFFRRTKEGKYLRNDVPWPD